MTLRRLSLLGLGLLAACSGQDAASDPESSAVPNYGGVAGGGAAAPAAGVGVRGYDRPPGMPIGRGAAGDDEGPAPAATGGSGADLPADEPDPLVIPTFEAPPAEQPPPCSGCVELNMRVDDINQRDEFVFSAGGVAVTRVVWTLIIPFNSDQLFVQPFVDSAYGTYTDLDANAFAIDTPVELVHQYSGTANNVGIAIGSAGAWTGDMTMSVFVDSVRLEGAAATASRAFDTDAQGLATRSSAHEPRVVHHP